MPSVSKKQQKFMGIVRSIQKGEQPAGKFSKDAQKAAKKMKKSSVKKYAKTKHDDLPIKKESKTSNMMKAVRKGGTAGPWDIIISKNNKIVKRVSVKNLKEIPAEMDDVKKKFPNHKIGIESKYGKIVYREADLGLTYKKGKTVKVKHKTSGKSIVIIDKPNVRKEYEKIGFFAEGSCGYGIDGKLGKEPAGPHLIKKKKKKVNEDVQDLKKVVKELENASKMHLAQSKRIQSHLDDMNVDEKVIKVSKKDDVPGNAMKMSGEEKIKKLVYSGSNGKGSYEIKGKNLNVNGIRPRDKGFFVRHFTMKTGFRKANLYYDGVSWMDKNKKF